jgi:hypothetical protein
MVPVLSGAIVLGFAASVNADPRPLSKEEQARIDQTIDRAVAFLKRTQTDEGDWPKFRPHGYLVGQCALPAYALLEAGVSADNPVVQRAAAYIRPKVHATDRTYELSLALLFFDRLGDPKDEKLIQSLALRLIASQYRTGGWTYCTPTSSTAGETALLKSLEEMSKQTKEGKSAREVLRGLDVPRNLRALTIFQDPEKLPWADRQAKQGKKDVPPLVGTTDNSNTQFAMLALWVAQRHGIPMEPTYGVLVERFERSQFPDGWWPYRFGIKRVIHYSRSMICVGLLGLAIGSGLKLPSPGVGLPDQEQLRILRGLGALSEEIGVPAEQWKMNAPPEDLYFLWSVERVGMLYNLPSIGEKDWYRWGAEIIVTNQRARGGVIGTPFIGPAGPSKTEYGVTLNTAFALLFLKRSHPMKELTPKLPYTVKELNQGITSLLRGHTPLERSPKSSRNAKPGS